MSTVPLYHTAPPSPSIYLSRLQKKKCHQWCTAIYMTTTALCGTIAALCGTTHLLNSTSVHYLNHKWLLYYNKWLFKCQKLRLNYKWFHLFMYTKLLSFLYPNVFIQIFTNVKLVVIYLNICLWIGWMLLTQKCIHGILTLQKKI